MGARWIVALMLGLTGVGCSTSSGELPDPVVPLSRPAQLCVGQRRSGCISPETVQGWLAHPGLRVLQSAPTPSGTQGAYVLTLSVPSERGRRVFRAKWRPVSTRTPMNVPRREVGAFAVQTLFLKPHEYVVPPTHGRCISLGVYRATIDATADATFDRAPCVFGVLSYWLPDAVSINEAVDRGVLTGRHGMLDAALFHRSPSYRRSLANLNVLAHLVNHGDAHGGQFLMSDDPANPHLYAVDHSIAFESMKNPMVLLRDDWSRIRVPAIPLETARRLRALGPEDPLVLRIIEEYELRDGRLVAVERPAVRRPSGDGFRWVGDRLEVGLTEDEIDGVQERLRDLVRRITHREILTF